MVDKSGTGDSYDLTAGEDVSCAIRCDIPRLRPLLDDPEVSGDLFQFGHKREVADDGHLFLVSGTGDVIEPDDDVVAIGSGGSYALAAARALKENTELTAGDVVRKALEIAGEICIYTNKDIVVLELGGEGEGAG